MKSLHQLSKENQWQQQPAYLELLLRSLVGLDVIF